jgi:hypothetical protein
MHTRPLAFPTRRTVPTQCSWVDQRLVRDHPRDSLRHEAGTLSLCLVPVADAQGRRVSSERALCQRVAMTRTVWRQARQARLPGAFLASHRPLSQVLALGGDARGPAPALAPLSTDDAPVALQAVFTPIWEVWS